MCGRTARYRWEGRRAVPGTAHVPWSAWIVTPIPIWPTFPSATELLIANPFQNGVRLTFLRTRMSQPAHIRPKPSSDRSRLLEMTDPRAEVHVEARRWPRLFEVEAEPTIKRANWSRCRPIARMNPDVPKPAVTFGVIAQPPSCRRSRRSTG